MNKSCLIIVDMQNDFINPDGALHVPDSENLIPKIEQIISSINWDLIIFTQDWHPRDHVSFYTSHVDKKIGDTIDTQSGKQELWPPHCLQNHYGSQIITKLSKITPHIVVQKGYHKDKDSYSGFADQSNQSKTGLNEILQSHDVINVFICGVATNYCVKHTALHSLERGYKTHILSDATAATSLNPSNDLTLLEQSGIQLINCEQLISSYNNFI